MTVTQTGVKLPLESKVSKNPTRPIKKPKISIDNPLKAIVYVPVAIETPPPWPTIAALVERLIQFVPTYRATLTGVRGKRTIQIVLGLSGLTVAMAGKTWEFAAAGAVIAGLSLILPIPATRRSLWMMRWQKRQKPTAGLAWTPGDLLWDGTKLTVRVGGKVVRSFRPREAGYGVVSRQDSGVLELNRRGGFPKDRWLFNVVGEDVWLPLGQRQRLLGQADGIGMRQNDWEILASSFELESLR